MGFPPDHINGTKPHCSSPAPATQRRRVGLVYDERMCKHSTPRGEPHPENSDRIRAVWNKLTAAGIPQRCMVFDAKEVEDRYVAAVHTNKHINLIKTISSKKMASKKRNRVANQYDSIYFNKGSSESAYLAAGSVLEVAEKVAKGELNSAFAIVRPPGHHAEESEPMGFCLFNNVAIAANFLLNQKELGINKILIVDWDVHHGNGTQKMFWKDSRVLFFSVHRHENGSFYPNGDDGSHIMIGEGPGAGYNINVPWENDQCGDADYIAVWDRILIPVATEFNPDIIIISAGFDAALGDPLGGCRVTPHGYSVMLQKLMKFSRGKIIMALEGGYNLNSLANSVLACIEVLLEDKPIADSVEVYPLESTLRVVKAVREELNAFWPVLVDKLPEELMPASVSFTGAATTRMPSQARMSGSNLRAELNKPASTSQTSSTTGPTIPNVQIQSQINEIAAFVHAQAQEIADLRSKMATIEENSRQMLEMLAQTIQVNKQLQLSIEQLQLSHQRLQLSHQRLQLSHQQLQLSHEQLQTKHQELQLANANNERKLVECREENQRLKERIDKLFKERPRIESVKSFKSVLQTLTKKPQIQKTKT